MRLSGAELGAASDSSTCGYGRCGSSEGKCANAPHSRLGPLLAAAISCKGFYSREPLLHSLASGESRERAHVRCSGLPETTTSQGFVQATKDTIAAARHFPCGCHYLPTQMLELYLQVNDDCRPTKVTAPQRCPKSVARTSLTRSVSVRIKWLMPRRQKA